MSHRLDPAENPSPGSGSLQRFDPRLKLLLLLLLVITLFSARGFGSLLLLGLLALGLLIWQPLLRGRFWHYLSYVRWLLLFTFLLHLLMTPGRILFGLRFFSYDGLLRGLMVDTQLVLALLFTLLLSLVTSPGAVAWAANKFLRPMGRLGLPVAEAGGLLTLVLYFLPQIYRLGAPLVHQVQQPQHQGMVGRFQLLAKLLGDAVLALVEQADQLACALALGDKTQLGEAEDFAWQRRDSLCLILALLFISACWSL